MGLNTLTCVACNIAARELVKYFYNKTASEVAGWYKEKRDLSDLLSFEDIKIPETGVKGSIAKAALKNVPERNNGSCPAYDLILQDVYNIAGRFMIEREQAGDKEGVTKMRDVQVIATFLGNTKVKPWYYENMDKLYEKILKKLGD